MLYMVGKGAELLLTGAWLHGFAGIAGLGSTLSLIG